ncbi:hypothetical protein ADK70_11275 [Streptomyces rimosus subsp. pseudoverticillatus]|uniref:hypothetical protein n=1 Tax=Streptomyces rimosus TaxID=1927 RepID=UPI0006BF0F0E|nr:hypothetical protein [Streptomyces rimosus]KOT95338.1 hypothetical protein ADK70_11275 [Streptomyces rimosus subsp. pseudoverticillatus]
MMPATLAERPAGQGAPSVPARIDQFGTPHPNEPLRVGVRPADLFLSGAELLGVLAFSPGVNVLDDEMDDPEALRAHVRLGLLFSTPDGMDAYARLALRALRGESVGPNPPPVAYMRRLAAAVSRTFGVSVEAGR